jgi:hypothetical protein
MRLLTPRHLWLLQQDHSWSIAKCQTNLFRDWCPVGLHTAMCWECSKKCLYGVPDFYHDPPPWCWSTMRWYRLDVSGWWCTAGRSPGDDELSSRNYLEDILQKGFTEPGYWFKLDKTYQSETYSVLAEGNNLGREPVSFSFGFLGWGEIESTWYIDDRWRMWSSQWNENLQGKPKYSEKTCSSTTLSTSNTTWPDLGSNPDRHGGKPATNRLSQWLSWPQMIIRNCKLQGLHSSVNSCYRWCPPAVQTTMPDKLDSCES